MWACVCILDDECNVISLVLKLKIFFNKYAGVCVYTLGPV